MSESSNIVRFFVGSDFSRFFFLGGGGWGGGSEFSKYLNKWSSIPT